MDSVLVVKEQMSLRIEQNWKRSNKTFPHTLCVVSTSDETNHCGICLTKGVGPQGGASLYKILLRTPRNSISWIPKDLLTLTPTEKWKVKLLFIKFPSFFFSVYLRHYRTFASIAAEGLRQQKLKSESEFLATLQFHARWKTKRIHVSFIEHNVSWVFPFFSKKYNLFMAFPWTSCGNLIHYKILSFNLLYN